ncbi:DUF1064 domain-containing protein [Paenibacillus aceti]|uniref:DUF1064 domain-containing protein n=1 Tax=Paenibacillus aceti TaxID=1820010 RepID=A0ABQ1VPR5_9BACL|nr:DUF1064 domain-containing protein [Paenibacillus aceti]GGF86539.1 hypothetical protein GCM10010913_05050 [Paenibacillus aceti]
MSKYNATKVIVTPDGTLFEAWLVEKYELDVQGILFDSKMEGEYYQELLLKKKYGEIKDFSCQPKFVLQEQPKITYIADFLITDLDGSKRVIDIKGVETSTFMVKLKLFQALYPTFHIEILIKKRGEFVPLEQVKKEKAARKRARNKLLNQAEGKMKNDRNSWNGNEIHGNQKRGRR